MLIVLIILIACFWLLSAVIESDERFAQLRNWYTVRFHYYCCEMHERFPKLYKQEKEKEKEKSLDKYLDLPSNIRRMIVDQLRAKDGRRYTRCSRRSRKEVKGSNYYIHSLEMCADDENRIFISIGYNKSLIFVKENGKHWIGQENNFVGSRDKYLWRKELDDSMDLAEHAAEFFKKLLSEYQNKIKELTFQGILFETKLKDYDFGIENLSNLKFLNLHSEMDLPLYFSKLQRPLRFFYINGKTDRFLNECNQVYQVQSSVRIFEAKLKDEQFQRLSARCAFLNIGYLTEEGIYNFVRSWQNGTIGRKVMNYVEWNNLQNSDFDLYQLFALFGQKFNLFEEENVIEIKHDKEEGKRAKLSYYNYKNENYLSFEVLRNKEQDDQSDIL